MARHPIPSLALVAICSISARAQTQLTTVSGVITDPTCASGFFLGLNELAEVNILTEIFNAENEGHGGAVIDMITKSGTNQFHGSLWELHRDASMDAKNYFDLAANPIPPFVRHQFGAGIGGPLMRDRRFFFVNYTQSALAMGGNGDAIFKNAAGNFAGNLGQILTTAGAARQIQLVGRFTF